VRRRTPQQAAGYSRTCSISWGRLSADQTKSLSTVAVIYLIFGLIMRFTSTYWACLFSMQSSAKSLNCILAWHVYVPLDTQSRWKSRLSDLMPYDLLTKLAPSHRFSKWEISVSYSQKTCLICTDRLDRVLIHANERHRGYNLYNKIDVNREDLVSHVIDSFLIASLENQPGSHDRKAFYIEIGGYRL
jgi:hypothetical protein